MKPDQRIQEGMPWQCSLDGERVRESREEFRGAAPKNARPKREAATPTGRSRQGTRANKSSASGRGPPINGTLLAGTLSAAGLDNGREFSLNAMSKGEARSNLSSEWSDILYVCNSFYMFCNMNAQRDSYASGTRRWVPLAVAYSAVTSIR